MLQLLFYDNLALLHQIQKLLLRYWFPDLSDKVRNELDAHLSAARLGQELPQLIHVFLVVLIIVHAVRHKLYDHSEMVLQLLICLEVLEESLGIVQYRVLGVLALLFRHKVRVSDNENDLYFVLCRICPLLFQGHEIVLEYQLQNVVVAGLEAANICEPHVHYQHVGNCTGKNAYLLLD